MEHKQYSEKVTNRMIELINNHAILPDDLVKILEPIFKSLRLKTHVNFANEQGKSYNGAKYRLSKLESIQIDGVKFYITDEPC